MATVHGFAHIDSCLVPNKCEVSHEDHLCITHTDWETEDGDTQRVRHTPWMSSVEGMGLSGRQILFKSLSLKHSQELGRWLCGQSSWYLYIYIYIYFIFLWEKLPSVSLYVEQRCCSLGMKKLSSIMRGRIAWWPMCPELRNWGCKPREEFPWGQIVGNIFQTTWRQGTVTSPSQVFSAVTLGLAGLCRKAWPSPLGGLGGGYQWFLPEETPWVSGKSLLRRPKREICKYHMQIYANIFPWGGGIRERYWNLPVYAAHKVSDLLGFTWAWTSHLAHLWMLDSWLSRCTLGICISFLFFTFGERSHHLCRTAVFYSAPQEEMLVT